MLWFDPQSSAPPAVHSCLISGGGVMSVVSGLPADSLRSCPSGGGLGEPASRTWNSQQTHSHPFNGLLSKTTWVSRYQKGKTSLDFTGARNTEWQWHQLGYMLKTDNHASTPPQLFYRPDALPAAQPTVLKH